MWEEGPVTAKELCPQNEAHDTQRRQLHNARGRHFLSPRPVSMSAFVAAPLADASVHRALPLVVTFGVQSLRFCRL